VKRNGDRIDKQFRVALGIGSLAPWPQAKKVPRKKYHQFLHAPGKYQVMWVEFICSDSVVYDRAEDPATNSKDKARARRLRGIANALIYPFHDSEVGTAPPKRVRQLPTKKRSADDMAASDAPTGSTPGPVSGGSDVAGSVNVAPGLRAPTSPPPWRPSRRPGKVDKRLLGRLNDETDDEEFWSTGDPEPEQDRDRGRICTWCSREITLDQTCASCDVCAAGPFHMVHFRQHRRTMHS